MEIPSDWWFGEEHHRPICERLRLAGVAAYEEHSGGGNFHVAFSRAGKFVLADANDGVWRAGIYVSHADVYENEHENQYVESEHLTLWDADPHDVVEWLLRLPVCDTICMDSFSLGTECRRRAPIPLWFVTNPRRPPEYHCEEHAASTLRRLPSAFTDRDPHHA